MSFSKIKIWFLPILLLVILTGCSGVSMLSGQSVEDLYSKQFLINIGKIKQQYSSGKKQLALNSLKRLKEEEMLPSEKSMRRNLIGVIQFSMEEYEQAIFNFDIALASSGLDYSLTAQIYLNLASSYYKMGLAEKSFSSLELVVPKNLGEKEKNKFYMLKIVVSKELGDSRSALLALIELEGELSTLQEVKSSKRFSELVNTFFNLDPSERLRILEEFEEKNLVVIGYLGYLEAEKRYFTGEKDEARQILEWVQSKFAKDRDIQFLVSGFQFRIANYAKMTLKSLGIILPLSGQKRKFGKRALLGIDSGFREKLMAAGFSLNIKDSKGSGVVGALRVKELVEKKSVSVIIGGLFPLAAEKEYLEARKYGVLFISLSQIYLPKERKDHLLIEIPGSIESQINTLCSEEMISNLGNNAAILYSDDAAGEAYVSEFWRVAKERNINISGALSYSTKQTDFRDQVKNLLGLKFKRDRQEELDLISEIHSLEKSKSIKRIQNLRPDIDFDWIFIPAAPKTALQILPSFRYFDAFNLNLIGNPSWRSRSLSKESFKLGKLFFVGEDTLAARERFNNRFNKIHRRNAKLIEMYSYDAMKTIQTLVLDSNFSSRTELDGHILETKELPGITGTWTQQQGIWIKKMSLLKLRRGKVEKFIGELSAI